MPPSTLAVADAPPVDAPIAMISVAAVVAGAAHRFDQPAGETFTRADARLVDDVGGAGAEQLVVATAGVAAHHDHRQRERRHDVAQELIAVHARHVDVEQHHVGRVLHEAVARLVGIAGLGDDLDVAGAAQRRAQDLTERRRIVDDEDADHDAAG
jgi:hypothetical protein